MNKNKIIFITMISVSVLLILASGAYAYYQTTISGRIDGTIATWSFKANNQTDSFNIDMGDLYPGKEGTYNIVLSAAGSSLDVYYELLFPGISQNLYWDSAHNTSLGYSCSQQGKYGIIPAGESVTIPIYYSWPYGDGPEEYYDFSTNCNVQIIGQQYTGYSGSIPMNLFELNGFAWDTANGYFGDCSSGD